MPNHFSNDLLNDSKQLSEKQRLQLRPIIEQEALAWAVAKVDNHEIDQINILNASFLAMHRALDQLQVRPEYIIVDGNRFKAYQQIPHQCIVKGDSKSYNIAAASIIAKVSRDRYIKEMDSIYPQYGFSKHKGYGTKEHMENLRKYGPCEIHRKTFLKNI